MKKIFVLGMSPLPFENDRKVYGTGIRTWQFILPLLEKGFRICVCNYAIPSAYRDDFKSVFKKDVAKKSGYRFEYHILKKDDFENIGLVSRIFSEFKPDCMIGCTFYPSYIASRMLHNIKDRSVPFWADLFGHVMAEAQARANIDKDDSCLFHYWNSEYNIVSNADIFSCVSSRQQYALVGELGAVGRLNRYTAGYDFASVIPCGIPRERYMHTRDVIRGRDGIKKDDFIVLWTGGYNTWTDIDTLFKGLTLAMSKNPKIKFVSTGGEIPEQDIKTYPRFLSMIKGSPYRDRFVMKGWIRGEDVPNYYLEADVGINIDKDIYEVRLGSKNRILDWLRAGLCVLSSNVCELTDLIEKAKIGYTFKPYDHEELSSKVLYLAGNSDEVKKTADAGRRYGLENFNFERTTLKLREWAASPSYSPDKGKERKIFFKREEAVKNLVKITLGQKKMIEERDKRISELEGIVKKSLIYRIYGYLRIIKRKMSR
jgi:glycosyltransferase involved in cell wall biosynthesis